MPNCPYCNADVSPQAKHCPSCGDALWDQKISNFKNHETTQMVGKAAKTTFWTFWKISGWLSALIVGLLVFFFLVGVITQ